MLRFLWLMVFLVAAPGFQEPVSRPRGERENEVYRIYSLLMTGPGTSHGEDNNPRYLSLRVRWPRIENCPVYDRPKRGRPNSRRLWQTLRPGGRRHEC
jgi:hypothetical protein